MDETYIPDMNQRLTVYRRMAAVRTAEELDRLMDEVRDRYGPPPDSVLNLAEYASIRLMADRIRVESIDREGPTVVLKFRPDAKLDPGLAVPDHRGARRHRPAAAGDAEAGPESGGKGGQAAGAGQAPTCCENAGWQAEKGGRPGGAGVLVGRPGEGRGRDGGLLAGARSCARRRRIRGPKAGCSPGSGVCSGS